MGMIALSLEQLLQLWISKPAVLSGFPQPRGLCSWLCSAAALPLDWESSRGLVRSSGSLGGLAAGPESVVYRPCAVG